jgi:hypothetical protein
MHRPDAIAVRILRQRGAPPDGITTFRTDLAELLRMVGRVGRDPALLLLTVRALRQRSGSSVRLADLAWIMGASPLRIRCWLDRLAAADLVVYDATNGTIDVEVRESGLATFAEVQPPHMLLRYELPTHWFIHVLPRIGRPAFAVYLYLLTRDGTQAPATLLLPLLAHAVGLRTVLHARLSLWRLRRFGLIARDPARSGLVVRDPPPLTPAARRRLRFRRRYGYAVITRWVGRIVVLLALLLAILLLTRKPL